jgi:hypothetical protein
MKTNVGIYDGALRVVLGLAILSLLVVGPRTWWGLLGLIPLVTAIAGTCPIYTLFGINTCSSAGRPPRQA